MGIEPYITPECRCCGAKDADTRHAQGRVRRLVTQHQPLVKVIAKLLKRQPVKHTVEDGAPLTVDQDFRMDLVVPAGKLEEEEATKSAYHQKSLLMNVTYAEPQAATYLQRGSATNDGTVAATSEAPKRAHYASPSHVSFGERIFKLTTLAVESFGRLGRNGEEILEQLATSVVRGEEGAGKMRKGVSMECIKQVISVIVQVAISGTGATVPTRSDRKAGREDSGRLWGGYSPTWSMGVEDRSHVGREKYMPTRGIEK